MNYCPQKMNFLVITPLYLNRFCVFINLLNSTTFQNLFKDLTVSLMCSMIDQFNRQYFTVWPAKFRSLLN